MTSPFLPPFQGRLVRRVPSASDLASRRSCCLGPRDREILAAVGLHGVLTAGLIGLAFFTPSSSASIRPSSRAFARLRQLWLWGYLDRYDLPAPRGMLGRVPCVYALGVAGVPIAARQLDRACAPVVGLLERLDPRFVQHELTAAAVWAHLQSLVCTGAIDACCWTPERVLRAQRRRVQDPVTNQWLPVLFDGEAEMIGRDGTVRRLLVEIDRGSLTIDRFRRKLRARELCVAGKQDSDDADVASCTLLILTESWERLRGLYRAGREVVDQARWAQYLLATTDLLRPERLPWDGAWLTLGGAYVGLLGDSRDCQNETLQRSGVAVRATDRLNYVGRPPIGSEASGRSATAQVRRRGR